MISDDEEIAAEKQLARLSKEWTAGVYGFFKPDPIIEYAGGRRAHTFICAATHCRGAT
ncbi:uncharacterized protein LACBIDRAFT_317094 [Laccaria bicolor S238N-H82]|uniref:Predicted protein n=1 Tax=Laccaria bicolor (strain S238N-H82 / ATCC MYA-4686) TaxID=486041 RepID=B0D4E2_LACBS|nr:uncharacterized protein LACBIDRAFT_317094 [Laccaria bicolor S238N-H82]EDR10327.1 predicted protein [Laccaria bicolor S238N-H82]|eukprot:XP_001878777.1 predicted protein [Laccaria bicolor S238N-H82]